MKDMTSTATAMMTEEEKTEIERQMNEGRDGAAATPTVAGAPAARTHLNAVIYVVFLRLTYGFEI